MDYYSIVVTIIVITKYRYKKKRGFPTLKPWDRRK